MTGKSYALRKGLPRLAPDPVILKVEPASQDTARLSTWLDRHLVNDGRSADYSSLPPESCDRENADRKVSKSLRLEIRLVLSIVEAAVANARDCFTASGEVAHFISTFARLLWQLRRKLLLEQCRLTSHPHDVPSSFCPLEGACSHLSPRGSHTDRFPW